MNYKFTKKLKVCFIDNIELLIQKSYYNLCKGLHGSLNNLFLGGEHHGR